jgi:hypothetical protein
VGGNVRNLGLVTMSGGQRLVTMSGGQRLVTMSGGQRLEPMDDASDKASPFTHVTKR